MERPLRNLLEFRQRVLTALHGYNTTKRRNITSAAGSQSLTTK